MDEKFEYQYLPIEQAKSGDIVQYQGETNKYAIKDNFYIVATRGYLGNNSIDINDELCRSNTWDIIDDKDDSILWKLVKTKPVKDTKKGALLIRTSGDMFFSQIDIGQTCITTKEYDGNEWIYGRNTKTKYKNCWYPTDFVEICRKEIITLDDIEIGSKWKRLEAHGVGKIGEIITVIGKNELLKIICFNGDRSLHLKDFLKRFKSLAEKVEEEQPKAFYKESEEPWTTDELAKLSTYLGIKSIKPELSKLRRKYIYNNYSNNNYFPWEEQHPRDVEGIYDRISYESIFEPTKETPTKAHRLYIKTTEIDSPEMDEFMEEWRKYRKKDKYSKPVYIYHKNGDFHDQSKGIAPNEWEDSKGYISFIECDNILEYENPKECCLTSLDLATASDNIAIAGNLYATDACCIAASDLCPEWTPDQYLASAIAATTNQTQGNTMNPTNVTIEVNGKTIDLCPEAKAAKVLTDLKARKKYTVVVFNIDGSYSETLYFNAKNEDKAIAKMTKILQNPANIGKTATLHREIEILTTSIPVVKADV